MKRLCFATDWRCLADTGNIFQNNVALQKNEQNTLDIISKIAQNFQGTSLRIHNLLDLYK